MAWGQVIKEATFQTKVLDLCRFYRLKTYHTYDSRRSTPGFPDLVIVGPRGIVYAELKGTTGKATLAQLDWIEALNNAGGKAYLWYPGDWPEIQDVLKSLTNAGART